MIFKILENANELIKLIACGIAWLKESKKAMGGKPSVPSLSHISSPLSFFNDNRSKPHLNVWLTQTQSLLLLSNDNVR